jgi:hypothetical protein
MMQENLLCDALRSYIEMSLSSFKLEAVRKNGEEPKLVQLKLIDGYLPPKRSTSNEDHPFVLVRPDGATTDDGVTQAEVSIVIGVWQSEFNGHRDCISAMAKIRQALFELPARTLANRYQLNGPVVWENLAEQPWPYWQLNMKTTWLMRGPTTNEPYYDYSMDDEIR